MKNEFRRFIVVKELEMYDYEGREENTFYPGEEYLLKIHKDENGLVHVEDYYGLYPIIFDSEEEFAEYWEEV